MTGRAFKKQVTTIASCGSVGFLVAFGPLIYLLIKFVLYNWDLNRMKWRLDDQKVSFSKFPLATSFRSSVSNENYEHDIK